MAAPHPPLARSRHRSRRRPDQRGAAAIEFALVMVPVLYLLLGVITWGYILAFRQTMSQGAAEGARAAAVVPPGFTSEQQLASARAAVSEALHSYGLTCTEAGLMNGSVSVGACTVSIATCANDADHNCVSVTVDYSYGRHPLVPVPGLSVATPSELEYTAVAEVSS
jgi:Flp pilus assembly protein TadG